MAECLLLKAGGGGVDCDAATAMKSDVLAGKTFGGKDSDELQGGSMPNQGAKTATLAAGGSYTIPAGYHNGSGKIIANSLASQTSATAAAGDIIKGKTAWVSGAKRTGTLEDRASQTNAVSVASSTSVGLVRIPFGAYRTKSGSGYPEIVLSKSQIDYIAKQRYGGVAFNGATFDGVLLSGVANGSIYYFYDGREIDHICNVTTDPNYMKDVERISFSTDYKWKWAKELSTWRCAHSKLSTSFHRKIIFNRSVNLDLIKSISVTINIDGVWHCYGSKPYWDTSVQWYFIPLTSKDYKKEGTKRNYGNTYLEWKPQIAQIEPSPVKITIRENEFKKNDTYIDGREMEKPFPTIYSGYRVGVTKTYTLDVSAINGERICVLNYNHINTFDLDGGSGRGTYMCCKYSIKEIKFTPR